MNPTEPQIREIVRQVLNQTPSSGDPLPQIFHAGASRIGINSGGGPVELPLNRMIDHTILKADATETDVLKLLEEAKQYHFFSVCINPCWVPLAARELRGTDTKVCTVIGFPLGANSTEAKVREAQIAIRQGANELDMVINIGALKSKNYCLVEEDIRAVVQTSRAGILFKVIIETAYLTDEEKIIACELAKRAGADFVKTSTGFAPSGAKAADVALMRLVVGSEIGVKASGGIRDTQTAELMVQAGANRLGVSASVAIISKCGEPRKTPGY